MRRIESASERDERRVVDAYPALRRFAFVVVDSDTDPDDVLHDALVRTLARGTLDDIDDLVAYVRQVITHVASNQRRSLGNRRRALSRLGPPPDEADSEQERPSDLGDLMLLKPSDRAALYLHVVEQQTHRAIAETLGLSEVAVRARVSRALKRLRVETEEEVSRGNVG